MGRFINAIDALLAPKPKPKPDPTPVNVRVKLDDGRIITPVVLKLPPNGKGPDVHEYVAYGPESVGYFNDAALLVDILPQHSTLHLALLRVVTQVGGWMKFAPMPMDLVERTTVTRD